MKHYSNATRGYYRMTDMYPKYDPDVEYEIMFGFYPDDDDIGLNASEMAMRWYALGNQDWSPRLEVFCGSWQALYLMQDLLYALSLKEKSITPKEFCALLDSLGFKDKSNK